MKRALLLMVVLLLGGCMTLSKQDSKPEPLPAFDAKWNYGDPAGTEKVFRDILPAAKESGDLSYYVQLLTQIARTEGLQRKFDDAHNTLDMAESLLTDDLVRAKIRYLLERGRAYNSSNRREESKPLFLEAWDVAVENGEDSYAIDAAHMLGIVETPEKQLEWAGKAIELAEKTDDMKARNWLGPLYNNTGWSYHDLKQYDKAEELFEKSLIWREEMKDENGTRIAKWTIARNYRFLDRIDEALVIHHGLLEEIEAKGLEQDGYIYEELGECLLLKGKEDEAGDYFGQAFDLLSKDQWLTANEPDRLNRLKELGSR